MNGFILGIFHAFHDASACLLKDGQLIAMAEEERFNREKHTAEFPAGAIRYCLDVAGVSLSDVSVAYGFDPNRFFRHQLTSSLSRLPQSLHLLRPGASYMSLPRKVRSMYKMNRLFAEHLHSQPRSIEFVSHHLAHAYSTFFSSPFDDAAVFIVDGFGEEESTTFFRGEGSALAPLASVALPHSLGVFYGAVTQYLGFRPHADEYKVMGMAAYGEDRHEAAFGEILRRKGPLGFELDQRYIRLYTHGVKHWFSPALADALGTPRLEREPYEQRHFDIACSAQRRLEEVVLGLGRELRQETQLANVCIAGGVGQNVLANGRLLREAGFEGLYVPPVSSDSGISLGSALALHHRRGGERSFALEDAAWGPEYDDSACERALSARDLEATTAPDPHQRVAEAIADGKVVGYFDGRMEVGPRALGHRSILADPRRDDIKDVLNARIKNREFFRPFAPVVLEESCDQYFDLDRPSPFMTLVARVKRPELLPGITHEDGTARVQTVSPEQNPNLAALLRAFATITGVPVLLNTSFNENEPIVCTPEQAIDCFLRTHLDMVVFNGRLWAQKTPNAASVPPPAA